MCKILIAGAGGAPSEGVIYSLLKSPEHEEIIGMGADPSDLIMSQAHKKIQVPWSFEKTYHDALLRVLNSEKPDLVHFQNDIEIFYASQMRDEIVKTGTKIFMPDHKVIETCVNKYNSYLAFKDAGMKVPRNILLNDETDLKPAFDELKDSNGYVWLRASSMGGGGKGALPTNDLNMAKAWIDRHNGWGDYIAAEMLTAQTITWMSIWYKGELIVAQTRKRSGWIHGNRTESGVTGVTKVGITYSDELVDKVAQSAIYSVTDKPHGIFGVDMTYDKDGYPNPTEINISRFFTTIRFFTEAGLNMPVIFKDLALYGRKPDLKKKINPLQNGLMWFRAMDAKPLLLSNEEFENGITKV